jgi:hypothetical protein
MRSALAVVLISGTLLAGVAAQTTSTKTSEIHQLYVTDQAERGVTIDGVKPAETTPEQMSSNDAERRKRAHQLLDQRALQSGADFHDAAFIFQHGDTPDDYLLAHVLAMAAVAKGDGRGRWIAAATLDRYLQSIGQPQVFGTQYLTRGYLEFLNEIRAKQNTAKEASKNQLQEQAGAGAEATSEVVKPQKAAASAADQDAKKWDEYLQEPYNSSLISNALRLQYCVPTLREQKERVAELNGGKPASHKPIPGCTK